MQVLDNQTETEVMIAVEQEKDSSALEETFLKIPGVKGIQRKPTKTTYLMRRNTTAQTEIGGKKIYVTKMPLWILMKLFQLCLPQET